MKFKYVPHHGKSPEEFTFKNSILDEMKKFFAREDIIKRVNENKWLGVFVEWEKLESWTCRVLADFLTFAGIDFLNKNYNNNTDSEKISYLNCIVDDFQLSKDSIMVEKDGKWVKYYE